MTTQSTADFNADTDAVLEEIRETRDPVILTQGGHDVAVVVDVESYQGLLDELALLRDIQRGLADVEAGRVVPQEEVRVLLQDRYGQ